MEPVDAPTRVEGHDGSIYSPILEPAATRGGPCSAFHELGDVNIEILDCTRLRRNSSNALRLNLLYEVDEVLCTMLDDWKDRSVPNRSIGTKEHCRI